MKNNIVRRVSISAFVLILLLTNIFTAYAALGPVNVTSTKPAGWNYNTPAENVFKIQGSNKEFILLDIDTTVPGDPKYFILAKDSYGQKVFDSDKTQKFDIADSNNIAYWLNNGFIASGNGPGNILPGEIIPHIDTNHAWITEAGHPNGNCPDDYHTTAGIVLLSHTEWLQYITKFGVKDAMSGSYGWWLRTGRGLGVVETDTGVVLYSSVDNGVTDKCGTTGGNVTTSVNQFVRPAFYLNRSFFSEVKLDVSTLGENVKKAVVDNYTLDELQGPGSAGYSDADLFLLGYQVPNNIGIGTFESGTDGWTVNNDSQAVGTLIQDSTTFYEGIKSGKLSADFTAGGDYVKTNKALAVPFSASGISFRVKTQDFTSLYVSAADVSGEIHSIMVNLQSTGSWQKISVNTLEATEHTGGDGNGVFDLPLKEISITAKKVDLVSGKTTGTIYLDDFKIAVYDDITDNSGFESGVWKGATAGFSSDASAPHSGSKSAKVMGSPEEQLMRTVFKVDYRRLYEFSLWIKTDAVSGTDSVKINMIRIDNAGNPIGEGKINLISSGGTRDWTKFTANIGDYPASAAYVLVELALDAETTGEVYFDDVSVSTITENITMNMGNGPTYLFRPSEAEFEASFSISGTIPKTYTIEYSVAGGGKTFQPASVVVNDSSTKVQRVILDNLYNGKLVLTATVKYGDREVNSYTKTFTVMEDYEPQFWDSHSIMGVSAHFGFENHQGPIEAEVLRRTGIRVIRDELSWGRIEKTKGVYDFTFMDTVFSNIHDADRSNADFIAVLDYDNIHYSGAGVSNSKIGPAHKEYIEAWGNYVYATALHFKGKIDKYEIWNEPNIDFWRPAPNVIDYSNVVKVASQAIKRADPEAKVIAGSVANQNGPKFLVEMLEQGLYPYIDGISYHPYRNPDNPEPGFRYRLQEYANILEDFGGWKEVYSTEVGWSTMAGSGGVTEANQALYNTKHYLIGLSYGLKTSHVFQVREDGTDVTNRTNMYGIIKNNYEMKMTIPAFGQLSKVINGAVFMGEISPVNKLQAFVFMKDNQPLVALWSSALTPITYDFGAENITVKDLYGNPVAINGAQVTVGESILYVYGLSQGWISKAAYTVLETGYGNWLTKWQPKLSGTAQGDAIVAGVTALRNYASQAKSSSAAPGENEIQAKFEEHNAMGDALIQMAKDNLRPLTENMLALNELWKAGQNWENLLAVATDTTYSIPAALSSDARIDAVNQKITTRIGQETYGGNLKFSETLLMYAKERNEWAKEGLSAGKPGLTNAWNQTAEKLTDWADTLVEIETVDNTNFMIHVEDPDLSVTNANTSVINTYEGLAVQKNVAITNSSLSGFSGIMEIVDPSGKALCTTVPVNVSAGETVKYPVTLFSDANTRLKSGTYTLMVRVKKDGNTFMEQTLPCTVGAKVSTELVPSNQAMASLNKIQVSLKNVFTGPVAGTAVLTTVPEGWVLEDTQVFSLNTAASGVLTFPVEKAKKTPFNDYVFGITVKDTDGTIMMPEKKIPLSFIVATKAEGPMEPQDFNGDMSNWVNAYPVNLGAPADPADPEAWKSSTAAAKIFTQWDDTSLYVLAKVHDDVQFNQNAGTTGSAAWNGDSIQMTIDINNEKTPAYAPGDYAYSVALNGSYDQLIYCSYQTVGLRPSSWIKIIRNDADNTTLYFTKIPKTELGNMQMEVGKQFGLNYAVNDADTLNRDRFFEFSGGLATSKNPSLYYTWTMTDVQVGIVKGDVNSDDTVDLLDILEVAKRNGAIKGDSVYRQLYDVNQDDKITTEDIDFIVNEIKKSY